MRFPIRSPDDANDEWSVFGRTAPSSRSSALAARIVPGDFAKPDGIFEIEYRADFVQPLEKSELLVAFFEDRELIIGLRLDLTSSRRNPSVAFPLSMR